MKKLKCNFTTPEQSKRLLELGVHADSADCYNLREHDDKVYLFQNQKESDNCISKIRLRLGLGHAMPCWSVGRLIEIYCFAAGIEYIKICLSEMSQIESMIRMIEIAVTVKTFDFSKLEE